MKHGQRICALLGQMIIPLFPAVAAESAIAPEIVRAENMRVEPDSKVVIVGNDNGRYTLSCNIKAEGCVTPVPGRDYYLFNKDTRWKMPGAKDVISLSFVQGWTVTYNDAENIALVPKDPSTPGGLGMYILESWSAKRR